MHLVVGTKFFELGQRQQGRSQRASRSLNMMPFAFDLGFLPEGCFLLVRWNRTQTGFHRISALW